MNKFYFHGLLKDGSERVRVLVTDLDYFVQCACADDRPQTVFAEKCVDGEWLQLGEILRSEIRFDFCNPERDEES